MWPSRKVTSSLKGGRIPSFVILSIPECTSILAGALAQIVAVVLVFVSFWIKMKQEEALLVTHFPNEYPAYQKRTKRIIPFVF